MAKKILYLTVTPPKRKGTYDAALKDLKRIYGDDAEIICRETLFLGEIEEAAVDVVAVDSELPIETLSEICKIAKETNKEVIRAKEVKEPTGAMIFNSKRNDQWKEYLYTFFYWEKVEECEIVLTKL